MALSVEKTNRTVNEAPWASTAVARGANENGFYTVDPDYLKYLNQIDSEIY